MEFLALVGLIVLGCWALLWLVVAAALVAPARLDAGVRGTSPAPRGKR
jgi:hypothetical protein